MTTSARSRTRRVLPRALVVAAAVLLSSWLSGCGPDDGGGGGGGGYVAQQVPSRGDGYQPL